MKIVSILGLTVQEAEYKNSSSLDIQDGRFKNATDLLLQQISHDDLIFLGTKESINKQSNDVCEKIRDLSVEFDEKNLDDVFNKTLNALKKDDDIVLDITHGFRYLPLISALGSSIASILYGKNIKIIFAKEIKFREEFEFINLDDYLEISIVSYLLTSFVKTLTIPDIYTHDNLIKSLKTFALNLHSNNLKALFENSLIDVRKNLDIAKNSEKYEFLKEIFEEIDKIIIKFEMAKNRDRFNQFYVLSNIMHKKDYLLIASTYLYEALPRYFYLKFLNLGVVVDNYKEFYKISSAINNYILNENLNDNFLKVSEFFYCSNRDILEKAKKLIDDTKTIRNNVAHLNENYSNEELQEQFQTILDEFYDFAIENDEFANLSTETNENKCSKALFKNIVTNKFISKFTLNLGKDTTKFKSKIEQILNKKPYEYDFLNIESNYKTKFLEFCNSEKFLEFKQMCSDYLNDKDVDIEKLSEILST